MQNTALASVTRLPTAARRKPNNHRYTDQWRAAQAMREAQPWPGESAGQRRAREAKARYRTPEFCRSTEMLVATLVFKVLTDEQKDRARQYLRTLADLSSFAEVMNDGLAILEKVK